MPFTREHGDLSIMKLTKIATSLLLGSVSLLSGCAQEVTELGSNAPANPDKSALASYTVRANASTVSAIAAGMNHTCVIIDGGVQCWGDNNLGLLGQGDVLPAAGRVQVVAPKSGVVAIAASEAHTCAVADGQVMCWGSNASGELGYVTTDVYSAAPELVEGLPDGVTSIGIGDGFSCALVGGGVKCWGANESGQLGDGTIEPSRRPVAVVGLESGVTAIEARSNHACAIANGRVMCWGGRGSSVTRLWSSDQDTLTDASSYTKVPVPILGLESGASAIAVSHEHICAIVDGAAYCWGDNTFKQLGSPTVGAGSLAPVPVQGLGSEVTEIVSGFDFSCAIASDVIRCWGQNAYGQLGNESYEGSETPVAVSALPGKAWLVSSGYYHSCAVVDDGLWCWGENSSAQLGDDSAGIKSAVPVEVTSQP